MPIQKTLVMMFRRDIHRLEYDPFAQYRFHFVLTWFWFLSMIRLPLVPKLYDYDLPALIIQEISLWANVATHFGAMSAAIAAKQTTQISTNEIETATQNALTTIFDA